MGSTRHWTAYRFAISMTALGIVLGGLALWLYLITPTSDTFVTPVFTRLSVTSNVKINTVQYQVVRPDPPRYEQVLLDLSAASPAAAGKATAQLSLPPGKTFRNCPACATSSSITATFVNGQARCHWTVSGTRLAWVLNLDTADAVLPQLTYKGPGDPLLVISYSGIRDASTYDWNTMPASLIRKDEIDWSVPTTNGFAEAEVATGTDHGVDHILANNGLITAALVGACAGALLAATQEAHQVSRSINSAEGTADEPEPPAVAR
jgi:hypothetical protein